MRFTGFLFICFLAGCSEELTIMDFEGDYPVVYAIINPYDTVHYVRVQKTFPLYTKSDLTNLTSESLLYQDVEVRLEGTVEGSILWTRSFQKVRIDREDGFFPSAGNHVFSLSESLPIELNRTYQGNYNLPSVDSLRLVVHIKDLKLTTMASAPVFEPGEVYPNPRGKIIRFYHEYSTKLVMPGSSIPEYIGPNVEGYQEIRITVHYKEYYNAYYETRSINWATNQGWQNGGYQLTPERLFNRMLLKIPDNKDVEVRILDSIDIEIIRPSSAFSEYWYVREYWENTDRPPFTNFDNSFGMFFTYKKGELTGFTLDRRTHDSLCNGTQYKSMKFKHW